MYVETAERAIELLELCVAERGADYKYKPQQNGAAHVYVYRGKPSCMVGLALWAAGVPLGDLKAHNCEDVLTLANQEPHLISKRAVDIFMVAQYAQDGNATWGEALENARRYLSEHPHNNG